MTEALSTLICSLTRFSQAGVLKASQSRRDTPIPHHIILYSLPQRSPVLRRAGSTSLHLRGLPKQLLSRGDWPVEQPRRQTIRPLIVLNTQHPAQHRPRGMRHRDTHPLRGAVSHSQLRRHLYQRGQMQGRGLHRSPRRPPLHLSHLRGNRLIHSAGHGCHPITKHPQQRAQVLRPPTSALHPHHRALQQIKNLPRTHRHPLRRHHCPTHSSTIAEESDNPRHHSHRHTQRRVRAQGRAGQESERTPPPWGGAGLPAPSFAPPSLPNQGPHSILAPPTGGRCARQDPLAFPLDCGASTTVHRARKGDGRARAPPTGAGSPQTTQGDHDARPDHTQPRAHRPR
jgi:hypothetical protein